MTGPVGFGSVCCRPNVTNSTLATFLMTVEDKLANKHDAVKKMGNKNLLITNEQELKMGFLLLDSSHT